MDPLDLFWNISQERQIDELRTRLEREHAERDLAAWDASRMKQLAGENLELKLRLGLLVRLLISKGIFSAAEFAAMIAEARPKA